MFPIGDMTQFALIIALIACIAALSKGYWHLVAAALSLPIFYFGILARMGTDELGIGATSFLIMFGVALIGGLIWGWMARRISGSISLLAPGLAILPGLTFAGFTLERQYVPFDCRNNGALFSMADHTFSIPRIDGYWEYRMDRKSLREHSWSPKQSWNSTKQKMAKFCRLTENGTRPIDVMSVSVGQRNGSTEINLVPSMTTWPDWDWNNFPRSDSQKFGTESIGAECYTRANKAYPTFSCAVWENPLPGIQVYAVSVRRAPEDAGETVAALQRELRQWFTTLEID